METDFQVGNFKIPMDLKDLYLEISMEFEKTIMDSIKNGERDEEVKEIS